MSDQPRSNAPGEEYFDPGAYLPLGGSLDEPQRPPLSKMAIWGLAIACLSLFVFGFLGIAGIVLCGAGLREVRKGRARGRGLAMAGAVIAALSFSFYLLSMLLANN